jgi:hypothetical protein
VELKPKCGDLLISSIRCDGDAGCFIGSCCSSHGPVVAPRSSSAIVSLLDPLN